MSTVKCISPIDGSLFAERPCLSQNQAFAATERARAAQADWARRPLQERIDLVRAGVAAIGAWAGAPAAAALGEEERFAPEAAEFAAEAAVLLLLALLVFLAELVFILVKK